MRYIISQETGDGQSNTWVVLWMLSSSSVWSLYLLVQLSHSEHLRDFSMRKCSSLRKENSRENIERRKNLLQKPRLSIKSVWSIFSIGVSPSGKAGDSESPIRRFESYHSSHIKSSSQTQMPAFHISYRNRLKYNKSSHSEDLFCIGFFTKYASFHDVLDTIGSWIRTF